jgi:hypothetical protein
VGKRGKRGKREEGREGREGRGKMEEGEGEYFCKNHGRNLLWGIHFFLSLELYTNIWFASLLYDLVRHQFSVPLYLSVRET